MTQQDALTILKSGYSTFLTGGAGSGKTYVVNAYIKYLREHGIEPAITASTGIAATHIGGMTIHAWSGIGIRDTMSDWDIELMEEKKYLWDRYDRVKVLIIDEISMLSGNFLDILDRICRAFRRNELPFGGIQIVLCGDLFQLPPVTRDGQIPVLAIESTAWKQLKPVICYLHEQHRQDDDVFTEILNAMRSNTVNGEHRELLYERVREYDPEDFQSITKLFTHNADVDAINDQALSEIDEEERVFTMTAKGKANLIETLRKSCLAPGILRLKIGAEVMFVKNNFERGFVNGTRGQVVDFDPDTELPVVKLMDGREIVVDQETWAVEDEGKILASITQVPLRHAWAITVHKSQGMTLDAAVIDISKSFTYGMGYVALSRVRSLSGLHLVGFSENALAIDPKIIAIDQQLRSLSASAESRIMRYDDQDLQKMHDDFIMRCGGTLELTQKIKKEKSPKGSTNTVSYDLIQEGNTLEEVAKIRNLTIGTIIGHLYHCKENGMPIDFNHIKPDEILIDEIRKAVATTWKNKKKPLQLSAVKNFLDRQGIDCDFETIKLGLLFVDTEIK